MDDQESLDRWLDDGWGAATGHTAFSRAAGINQLLDELYRELDSIGQYVETNGVDWCNGASVTLQGIIRYIEREML